MPYRADTLIMPALIALHECLCAELVTSDLAADCNCAIVHGAAVNVAPPVVGRGTAWVGVDTIFPSKTFPTQDTGTSACGAPLVATVTVGLLRCYAVKATGESPEQTLLYMDKQMADMAAMRRAIVCCSNLDQIDVSLGTYTPIGPEGGVYGGTWSVSLGSS
jgi:hypothetical protein